MQKYSKYQTTIEFFFKQKIEILFVEITNFETIHMNR